MVNEPAAWQLTVGELKKLLADADNSSVVALTVPKGGIGHDDLAVIYNLTVRNTDGPVVMFLPGNGFNGNVSNGA